MSTFKQQEEDLFQRCLEVPRDEREALARKLCRDCPEYLEGILALLKGSEGEPDFLGDLLESDFSKIASQLRSLAPPEEKAGDKIGRYKLLELIGEGAWGSVWLAEQTEDISRRVALKILKLGLKAEEFLTYFEGERRILAMMDHPNIARVLDAGTTTYDRPFLVMELVKSSPLIEYANRERLDVEDRVKLFVQVCHGVHHAHRKGVYHRDLKPSNILVSVYDDCAVPKIIDFGVAQTAFEKSSKRTLHFGAHTFVGTPIYCSPEQLDFDRLDVDHRSDIYSLGAIFYELLSGLPLLDPDRLEGMSREEICNVVSNTKPLKPSARFSKEAGPNRDRISDNRSSRSPQLERDLRGEIDWIAAKCLEKNPRDRYGSANDLAQDLEAFLKNDPVGAAPRVFAYRWRKLIVKNRPRYALWIEGLALILFCGFLFYISNREGNDVVRPAIVLTDRSVAILPIED